LHKVILFGNISNRLCKFWRIKKDESINGQIEPKDFEIWDFYKYISFGSAVKKLLKHIVFENENH
tara:strand:- start:1029 stop:1223 length:195 start_codon:yes stop_codon:yes gene_type:complete